MDKLTKEVNEWWNSLTDYQKKRIALVVGHLKELPKPFTSKKRDNI